MCKYCETPPGVEVVCTLTARGTYDAFNENKEEWHKAKYINNMGTKNVIEIENIKGKTHPTEKPVELNQILIENSSNENDTILDLFMGTGSCGVACKKLNRNFIGYEIDEKYFNIAKARIENTEV